MKNHTKKNFLIVSTDLGIAFLVIKLLNEDHNVKVYSKECDENCLTGILDNKHWIKDWKKYVDWADIIIFDDVGWGKHVERLRKQGKLVVGGSEYTDKLEMDREFGQKELEKAGVNILPEVEFKTIEQVEQHILKHPDRYVLKPCGIHDMDMTMIGESKDGKDLLQLIKHNEEPWKKKKIKSFFLQKYVEGVEIATGVPFDGNDFVYPINVSFEHKRLFPGGLGPLTWEMGTLLFYSNPVKLFKKTLFKMRNKLRKAGYVGDVDLSFIVNSKGIYPLEFTCRFGFPTAQILWKDEGRKAGDYFFKLATRKLKSKRVSREYKVGVCICVPSFPFNDKKEYEKYEGSLIQFDNKKMPGVHFVSVYVDDGQYLVDGPLPLIITAKAKTVSDARKKVYDRIKSIHIENMYYRRDIGETWKKESKLLKKWGYLDS